MKAFFSLFLFFVLAVVPAHPANTATAPAEPITSLAVLHSLTNEQAAHALHVAFEGTVTYFRPGDGDLFVQDGDDSIYVAVGPNLHLALGDRVLVTGRTHPSFRPEITADSVKLLHHGEPPPPIPGTFRQMIRGDLDTRRVNIRGTVQSASLIMDSGTQKLFLHIAMDDGSIDAEAVIDGPTHPIDLLDSQVELTGSVAGEFDYKSQLTGIILQIPTLAGINITQPPTVRSSQLPITPMDEILRGYDEQGHLQRIRIQGTVTYYQPGAAMVLQQGAKSLWVITQYEQPLTIGQQVDVTGFPTVHNGSLALNRGAVIDRGTSAPVTPQKLSADELDTGTHAFDLVTIEGKLLMAVRDSDQDHYVIVSGGHIYSAVLRHPEPGLESTLHPFKRVEINSIVRTTGICVVENGDRYLGHVAFEMLLRSPDDITVIHGPSLVSVRNLIYVVVFLLLVVAVFAWRQWAVEREIRSQTMETALLEKRRGSILEDINSSRRLSEILAQIFDLIASRLHGSICWIDLADGAHYGNPPLSNTQQYRSVALPLGSAERVQLGTLYAAFPQQSAPTSIEESTLSMAAALITLALETRRHYSDLVRRSEFDLLTEIRNRFAFEKELSHLLDAYSGTDRMFGIIYIDLDNFKQMNDNYGHQVGDQYLQAAVSRMINRIRPGDILARIGGDEFAVLIPQAADRADVLDVAQRLNDCFTAKFTVGNIQIEGSASFGIAFYPQDGTTQDELIRSADAAMYADKAAKSRPR